jgi:hypothetical protein
MKQNRDHRALVDDAERQGYEDMRRQLRRLDFFKPRYLEQNERVRLRDRD